MEKTNRITNQPTNQPTNRMKTKKPTEPKKLEVKNQEEGRQFGIQDVSACKNVNEVLEFLNIGEYTAEPIPEVCAGYQVIKDDYGHACAITKDSYDILQPAEAFAFLDAMANNLDITYTRAGFTHEGRRMFIEAEYGEMEIPHGQKKRKGDILKRRFITTTAFDATHSTETMGSCLRLICTNGMANWVDDKATRVSIRHTRNQRAVMGLALEQATGIKQVFLNMKQDITQLQKTKFTEKQMITASERFFKLADKEEEERTSRAKNNAERMVCQFHHEALGTFGETAWDAFNAFTAYQTHDRTFRNTKTTSRDENAFRVTNKQRDIKKFRHIITDLVGV